MAQARDLRVALWHAPLTRNGPGLLLRDLTEGEGSVTDFASAIVDTNADIIVLTRFDYDASGQTLRAFSALVNGAHTYVMPLRSNAGIPTGIDMDGDGRLAEPEDAQAYGRFPGQEALAVLSRFPILGDDVQMHNDFLWRDLPGGLLKASDHGGSSQRLSSGGHWTVPVEYTQRDQTHRITLFIGHAGPPVFDGPEDRNGRRNRDELRLWERIVELTDRPFVFMANTNLDPERGEGYRDAMAQFLSEQDIVDPLEGQVTAHWDSPGPMRVSYILPSSDFSVGAAKVWPVLEGQQHSLITVDLTLPDAALP